MTSVEACIAAHDEAEKSWTGSLSALPVPNRTAEEAVGPALAALARLRRASEAVLALAEETPMAQAAGPEMSREVEEMLVRWFAVGRMVTAGALGTSSHSMLKAPGLTSLLVPEWSDDESGYVHGCAITFMTYLQVADPDLAVMMRKPHGLFGPMGYTCAYALPQRMPDWPDTDPLRRPADAVGPGGHELGNWRRWLAAAEAGPGTDKSFARRLLMSALASRTAMMGAARAVVVAMGPRSEEIMRSMADWCDELVRLCGDLVSSARAGMASSGSDAAEAVRRASAAVRSHAAEAIPAAVPGGLVPGSFALSFGGCGFVVRRSAVPGSASLNAMSSVAARLVSGLWLFDVTALIRSCESVVAADRPDEMLRAVRRSERLLGAVGRTAAKARWHMVRDRRGRRLWL